jgi:hypothetical protein
MRRLARFIAGAPGPGARRDLLILVGAFVVTLPLVTARIYASDEVQYFAYLRSLWFDHDVSFENEYRYFYDAGVTRYDLFRDTFVVRRNESTGLAVSFATMGSAMLWSPFYAVADAVVRVRAAGGGAVVADGYSKPYVTAVAYGSALYGWLAVVLGWWATRRLIGPATALGSALAIWFGTPLTFYMYVAPPMSHACSAFAVAAFLSVWLRVRERWTIGGCAALGALAALMGMVREQDAFIAIGPGLDWLLTTRSRLRAHGAREGLDWRRVISQVLAAAATFLLVYAPQLWAYTVLNGSPRPSPLVARKMTWTSPHALEVLVSPSHGLLFWTPLVALAIAGLVVLLKGQGGKGSRGQTEAQGRRGAGAQGDPDGQEGRRAAGQETDRARVALCLLAAIASQVYVAGAVESWTVAGAFGQRRFLGLTLVFCVGLAALWARASGRTTRTLMATGAALGVWWNLGLTAQFGTGLMDRQRLEPTRNAYHTFVTIPARLPDLAYRYVFARSSFYKPPASAGPEP